MSVVTGIMVICSSVERGPQPRRSPPQFDRIDEWLVGQGYDPMKPVDDYLGGGKHPQFAAAGGGFNHLPEGEFAAFFRTLGWENPENAVCIMQPEDGPTMVVRPPNQ